MSPSPPALAPDRDPGVFARRRRRHDFEACAGVRALRWRSVAPVRAGFAVFAARRIAATLAGLRRGRASARHCSRWSRTTAAASAGASCAASCAGGTRSTAPDFEQVHVALDEGIGIGAQQREHRPGRACSRAARLLAAICESVWPSRTGDAVGGRRRGHVGGRGDGAGCGSGAGAGSAATR
jgi:hypothetical protein